MTYACPRCNEALDETEMLDTDILRCPKECGLIVAQNRMIPFADALAKELIAAMDLDEPIPQRPPDPRRATCPGCTGPMKNFGYLETRFVWLDRCGSCEVVWIDRDDLDVVVKLAGKNLKQAERHDDQRKELTAQLSRLVWACNDGYRFVAMDVLL